MGNIYVPDPAPRNRALELTGNPSLGSGLGLGATAEETWIRNPFQPLRHQQQFEAAGGTEVPDTGPTDTAIPPLFGAEPITPRANLMTPEEANQRFGIAGELTFDHPVRAGEAALLNKWKRDELKRQNILMRATPGVLPGAARLGVGFLVSAVDPLNVASAFIPVLGEARFARIAAATSLTTARLARGGLEGAVGAAVVEPIVYLQAQSEQADYTAYDSLLNLAFGTALGGGLHAGFGKLSDWISGQPIEMRETALRGAVAAIAEDRPVMVADIFGRRADLLSGTSLSTPTERFAPTFGVMDEPAPNPTPQGDTLSLPAVGKDGQIKIYETAQQALKAAKNAKRQGQSLTPQVQPNGTYRLVGESKRVEIRDTFVEERAALNEVKRTTPAERAGLEVVPRVQPDGTIRYAIIKGLTPEQAASVKANPALLDRMGHSPLAPVEAPEPTQSQLDETMAEVSRNVMTAQRLTYQPTTMEAAQAKNIEVLAEGWDQPITPEQGAEEAADLLEATNEAVQAAKRSGDLTDRDLETIKGDPETEKMTKGRAAAYEAAASCLARVA